MPSGAKSAWHEAARTASTVGALRYGRISGIGYCVTSVTRRRPARGPRSFHSTDPRPLPLAPVSAVAPTTCRRRLEPGGGSHERSSYPCSEASPIRRFGQFSVEISGRLFCRLAGVVVRRAQCLRRSKAARKHRCEFRADKRAAHEIRDPCTNEYVDANVERGSGKEDRPRRTDGVKRVRQIEGVPNGGHTYQYGVKTARFAPDRGDRVGRTGKTDRLISERRQDLLVAEQTVAVLVNDEHGFALAKPRRRNRLGSHRR